MHPFCSPEHHSFVKLQGLSPRHCRRSPGAGEAGTPVRAKILKKSTSQWIFLTSDAAVGFACKFLFQLKFSAFLVPLDYIQQKISPSLSVHFQESFQSLKRVCSIFINGLGFISLLFMSCLFVVSPVMWLEQAKVWIAKRMANQQALWDSIFTRSEYLKFAKLPWERSNKSAEHQYSYSYCLFSPGSKSVEKKQVL